MCETRDEKALPAAKIMGLRAPLVHVLFLLLRPVRIPNAGKQGRRRDVLHEANGGVAPGLEMMMQMVRVNMLQFWCFVMWLPWQRKG